jgi:tetratricopeptide (TPR) repeat protein
VRRAESSARGGARAAGAAVPPGVRLLAAALLTAALLAAGCAPPPAALSPLARGDLAFAAGDLAGAVRAYEESLATDPAGAGADRALFRLGLLYGAPASPVADPHRGLRLLAELVAAFPTSPYRDAAAHVLDLEYQIGGLRLALARRQARVDELQRQLEDQRHRLEGRVAAAQADLQERQAAMGDLQRRLRELAAKIEELKRIDLGEAPPP